MWPLLQEAREIDKAFVRKSAVFPIDIKIRYQDIEHYRQQRFELLLQASYRILAQWQDVRSFRTVVNELYNKAVSGAVTRNTQTLCHGNSHVEPLGAHSPSACAGPGYCHADHYQCYGTGS